MIYLVQTDTTVGFLSPSITLLAKAKQRAEQKPFLITTNSLHRVKQLSRTPKIHKKKVRKSKKTTFIYPNKKAIRVVRDTKHMLFLRKFDYLYSSSANKNKENFSLEYAKDKSDVIVEDSRGFSENQPSQLIKLGKKTLEKIR